MTLRGAPADARFPMLCANCGAAATIHVSCAKAFRRASGSDTPDSTVVLSVDVPFCDTCIARHRAEVQTPGVLTMLLSGFASGEMFGAVGFGAAATFTGYHALDELLRWRLSHAMVFLVLTLVFGLFARLLARQAWQDTEALRLPPPTSVSQAFDFSDNEPAPFQSPRFVCTMRNANFAAAFRALNPQAESR